MIMKKNEDYYDLRDGEVVKLLDYTDDYAVIEWFVITAMPIEEFKKNFSLVRNVISSLREWRDETESDGVRSRIDNILGNDD